MICDVRLRVSGWVQLGVLCPSLISQIGDEDVSHLFFFLSDQISPLLVLDEPGAHILGSEGATCFRKSGPRRALFRDPRLSSTPEVEEPDVFLTEKQNCQSRGDQILEDVEASFSLCASIRAEKWDEVDYYYNTVWGSPVQRSEGATPPPPLPPPIQLQVA